jgi:hypothetical protein
MLPEAITCEECGGAAKVRGYGRLTFSWETFSHQSQKPVLKTIRLTIDCPECGVRAQEYAPAAGRCVVESMSPGKLRATF